MKTYIKPTAEVIKLHIEHEVALVIGSNKGGKTVSGVDAGWTRRRMWDEEEEEQ